MIIDITGIELTPGNKGKDCLGLHTCCDECDYMMCCLAEKTDCENCTDTLCPNCN